jgi:formylglycine-generating enzyme required for sulfatase activity
MVQLLIAGVAFVFVRDYMSDGFTKQALANVLNKVASVGAETETDPTVAPEVTPPPVEEFAKQDVTSVQESAPAVEPEATPPVETAEVEAVDVPALPQAEVQATLPAAEPEPVLPAAPPAAEPEPELQAEVQAAPPPVEPEPVPQAEVQVSPPPVALEPAPQVEEQVAAVVPVPDPTPSNAGPAVVVPAQATVQAKREGQVFRDCETCPELVYIAPGRFMMGPATDGLSQKARAAAEQEVAVDTGFAIGRYEITFDDWELCVTAGGCVSTPADDGWGRGLRPVIHVSYIDITKQYLPWLSEITGQNYRLPTEAEWELASRGGATAGMRQTLEVGSKAQISCNYGNSSDVSAKTREIVWAGVGCNDGFAFTAPTGSFKPNSLGIYDMHGNVWEWVSDCWRATYETEEPVNPASCKYHVLRGGSWSSEFRFLRDGIWVGDAVAYRAAVRGWETSVKARNSIGFRVARSQP